MLELSEDKIEDIARVCHQVNMAYCKAANLGYQPTWELAPQWQKDSAIHGVKYHLSNPNASPEDSHKEWYDTKLKNGWIYGETKDEKFKTHPCMVPYNELPLEQRVKDYLFIEIVRTLSFIWS